MNYWLVAAGLVSAFTFGIHVFAGGPELHLPLMQSALPPVAKSVWSVVWHSISAMILLNAMAFLLAARPHAQARVICTYPLAVSFCITALFLFYGVTQHSSLTVLPQWTLFVASSVLAIIGLMNV